MNTHRLPHWFTVPLGSGERYRSVRRILAAENLHTVCKSAKCPNSGECWSAGTAAFMILGDTCTRNCRFCAVNQGVPGNIDPGEPARIRKAAETLNLDYVVITSVTRDDLQDGGASVFAAVINELKKSSRRMRVEVLIPDFNGVRSAVLTVLAAEPDILNHNIETVPALYPVVRPQAGYRRSLGVLEKTSAALGRNRTKSGLMAGLGESREQLSGVFKDLYHSGVGRLTIGQYLQPTRNHLPVHRFITPDEFEDIRCEALHLGFDSVVAGPLVRSSYHASEQFGDASMNIQI